MKRLTFIALTLCGFVFSSCLTNIVSSTISDSAVLSKYNYAAISNVMGYGTSSPILMDMEVRIYNALLTTRLTMLGDIEIEKLSEAQKQEALLIKFSVKQIVHPKNPNKAIAPSIVAINFVEYSTGKPVASFRSEYRKSLKSLAERDTNVAINNAIQLMKQSF